MSDASESNQAPLRQRRCPKCGKRFTFRTVEAWKPYPFCSERCRLIDLGSWLSEDYQIVEPAMDPDTLAEMDDESLEAMLREQQPGLFGQDEGDEDGL